MATKQQIGVVVSASGAKEYERQLKLLTQYTKEWKSETDKLTSSFDKNEKSMANVAKERDALEKEIDSLNKVLKLQQDRWGELATTMNGMPTDKQNLEFSKLRTSINETQIKINDLKNRIKELPTDSFFSRKQYIENTEKLAHQTGVLASKTAALDSAMELNGRTMGGVESKKQLLSAQVSALSTKLEVQKRRYEELRNEMLKNPSDQVKKDFNELGEEIYDTTKNITDLKKELKDLSQENDFTLFMQAFDEGTSKTGEYIKRIGSTMTRYVTMPIVAGATASVKAAVDWESAFNGVRKTVNASESEFTQLETLIKDIALETGTSSITLAGIAEQGGQLDVPIEMMEKFIRTIEALSISTNLNADEAAVDLARIMNIMGDSYDDFDRLGDVIVHLGNNTATSEGEIVALATRMASAGKAAKMTTPEVFAISAALSSVGITAEAGGSTMAQVLSKVTKEVAHFSDGTENKLDRIAQISGVSADEFAKAWTEKPAKAFEMFLTGLGNINEEDENLILILDELDMAGIRESNMLKALSSAQDESRGTTGLLTDALNLAEKAYSGVNDEGEEWSAMQDEANIRHEEAAANFNKLKEAVFQLGDTIGQKLLPHITPIVEKLTDWIDSLSELDDETWDNILKLMGYAAVFGPVIGAIGNGLIWTAKLKDAFGILKGAEGVAGATESIAGKGGFIEGLKTVGKTVTEKVIPTITDTVPGALGFTLVTLAGCFLGARAAATKMDEKMYESAEACEYVAKRYHWSEEKVNEFGYTWDSNGHLVELTNQKVYDSTKETSLDLMEEWYWARKNMRETTEGAVTDVNNAIQYRVPEVQSSAHKMVYTAVEEAKGAASETYGYGTELGNNFANGISATINNVRNAVHGIARTVQSYLHFSEPDVGPLSNFNSWMPDMMHQMASGITDNMYLVENALNGLTGGMANQMGQSYNYGGVVINLNVPQGANGYQLVDEIENALTQRTVRRRAVFG